MFPKPLIGPGLVHVHGLSHVTVQGELPASQCVFYFRLLLDVDIECSSEGFASFQRDGNVLIDSPESF